MGQQQRRTSSSQVEVFNPIAKTNELVGLYNIAVADGQINREGKTHRSSQLVIELMRFLIWEHENFKAVERYIEQRLGPFTDFIDDAELRALKTIDNEMEKTVKKQQEQDLLEWVQDSAPSETQPRIFHFGGKKTRKSNTKNSKRRSNRIFRK